MTSDVKKMEKIFGSIGKGKKREKKFLVLKRKKR